MMTFYFLSCPSPFSWLQTPLPFYRHFYVASFLPPDFGHILVSGLPPRLENRCWKVAISYNNSLEFSLRGTAGSFHILPYAQLTPNYSPFGLLLLKIKVFSYETEVCRDGRYEHRNSPLEPGGWEGTAGGICACPWPFRPGSAAEAPRLAPEGGRLSWGMHAAPEVPACPSPSAPSPPHPPVCSQVNRQWATKCCLSYLMLITTPA